MSEIVELDLERPVAGGRMLGRRDGQVVFVAGGIAGERVRARIDRVVKGTALATVVDILEPSADRREPQGDPACGGAVFAHIRYERQRALKQQILVDAFRRIGRLTIDPPDVAGSPERGYRLRARLHVARGRAGFLREGTHVLCDAAATHQLRPESTTVADALAGALGSESAGVEAIVVSENVAATERVLHLELRRDARAVRAEALAAAAGRVMAAHPDQLSGITLRASAGQALLAGGDSVSDTAADVFGSTEPVPIPANVVWRRTAGAFFQGNRFLLGGLVRRVLERAQGVRIADCYAGVGLFAVALAARGASVVAVEGEPVAAADLRCNAQPFGDRLEPVESDVEHFVSEPLPSPPDAVVVDPPRTGLSPAVVEGLSRWRVPRLVYVSCDPPTLARDAARLVAGGYRLESIDAFDLFPNTAHLESVATFVRG